MVQPLDRSIAASFNSIKEEAFGMGSLLVGFFYYSLRSKENIVTHAIMWCSQVWREMNPQIV